MSRRDILELSLAELESWCAERGLPRYRAAQIAAWLYQRGARDFHAMTNVSRALRDALAASFTIGSLALAKRSRSTDGTEKLLFRLRDGATIESVLIPDAGRLTLCVSTQVGCAMGCTFCATATLGFRRHLSRGEIVEQLLLARALAASGEPSNDDEGTLEAEEAAGLPGTESRGVADVDATGQREIVESRDAAATAEDPRRGRESGVRGAVDFSSGPAHAALASPPRASATGRITNVVFMGMGEPLHNYAGTVGAIETLTASWGVDFSHRRVTVSTVGLVPEMQRLLADTQAQLAVSLTSVDEATRRELMPITRRYSIADLLAACRALPLPRRKRITFEYVLLAGVNDRVEDARALARALAGIRCKVNLIPFNPFPGSRLRPSDPVSVARFQDVVRRAGVHATVRESRGPDIAAACGQLVAAEERRGGRRGPAAGHAAATAGFDAAMTS